MMSLDEFAAFNHEVNSDKCLDLEEKEANRLTDEQAREMISDISNCKSVSDFEGLSKFEKENFVKEFKKSGVSVRQICRLTGMSYYLVQRID